MKRGYRQITLILIIALLSSANLVLAAPKPLGTNVTAQEINNLFIAASSKANPSVVTIKSERIIRREFNHPFFEFWDFDFRPSPESRGRILGSGVIINSREGYIITNNHVVQESEDIFVDLEDGREVSAEIIGTDPPTDLAVIKVDADNLKQAIRGDSDELRIGEWVLAIGSPFSENLDHTVSAGIVSAKGRSNILSGNRYEDFIQTDAAINPGNSGGALVNLEGELVGINTAIATNGFSRSNAGVGFAIPINLVMRVAEDLIDHGKVTRAYLGVNIQPVDPALAKALDMKNPEGALVSEVHDGTPAEKGGVKEGDVIIKVDAISIRDNSHLRNVISSSRPGDRRKLTIIRDGREKTLTVELDELAEEALAATARDESREGSTGRAGLAVADLDSRDALRFDPRLDDGVVVTRVDPSSPAARVDIRPGDIIVRVGDTEVNDLRDYRQAMKAYKSGDTVLLRIARGDVLLFRGLELS
ncbi:MAG: Do family serine endopeptidase [Fidelibacterota bacterium]|nr:MAG: Do family serine endopeptidase [Candidatus Neomarinimicrobiota bacterium]